ncbi:MAG: fibronectin type III domain-containing protein, partial [bacterium]
MVAASASLLFVSCGGENSSEPDTIAPAAITDLEAVATGCDAASLTWTAPGDDGTSGRASSYDVRYSTVGITEGNWASASECAEEPAPKAAGQTESFTVGGLTSGTTYHFACKARDNGGNESALSNDASTVAGSTAIGWVNDGLANDEDWSSSATSLSANWSGSGCVTGYEYAVGTAQGGTNVVGWTPHASTDVTHNGLTLAEGGTYYFSVRGVAGATKGTPKSSDGVTVDTSAPDSRVEDLPGQVATPVFTVTWGGTDGASGIMNYDIQVSSDGGGSWGSWLPATTQNSGDFTGLNGHTYHFRSRAHDLAGNVEAYPDTPDAYTTVVLSTAIAWVYDGLGEDQQWVASSNTLSANWATAGYADEYQYAIGTTQGGTDVVGWTTAGTQTSTTRAGLSLADAETYYFSARSVFGGTPAAPTSSDGITADLTAPASQVGAMPDEVLSTVIP